MPKRRRREQTIFFPWERTGSLVRQLGFGRAKPFVYALVLLALMLGIADRERHALGVRSTRATLGVVARAVDAYRADHEGRCPSEVAELYARGYLSFDPLDAWGRPLRLVCPGFARPNRYDLSSDGPDGIFGGLDRIE